MSGDAAHRARALLGIAAEKLAEYDAGGPPFLQYVAKNLALQAQAWATLAVAESNAPPRSFADHTAQSVQAVAEASGLAGELRWHYGPTADDADPGKMWHYDCQGEVLIIDGGYICSRCEQQQDCGFEVIVTATDDPFAGIPNADDTENAAI